VWFHTAEALPYLSVAQEAVWQERRLLLRYRHGSGQTTRAVIEPLGLGAKARVWYLVAAEAGMMRVFRVARIEEATILDEHFARPEGFDLRTFWSTWRDAFERSIPRYPVILRVAPEAIRRLQALLGEEVEIHMERASPPDGAGRRTVPVAFERLDDAQRALLGCGGLVEAVQPAELRAGIAAAARWVTALHTS
jgi:predicted DNA-binding transcriptional regulator YafY